MPEAIEYGGAELPPTSAILDAIEYCWHSIGKPLRDEKTTSWAKQFQFREEPSPTVKGQKEFRAVVNRIFRRNGLAYKLTTRGRIKRLVGPVLQEALAAAQFQSGNDRLDQMLEAARQKFVDPDDEVRREALKELWDAWERLKTLGPGSNKRDQASSILDETAGTASPNFREVLEQEASALTDIGNAFEIRHSETTQEHLVQSAHVDYLFHRLFALVQLILRRQPGNAH